MSATTPGLPPDDNGPAGQPVVIRVDVRAAQQLADKLGRGQPLAPSDAVAYARLRRAGRLTPCFVPADGAALVRVRLRDLPAVALAAVLEWDTPPSALAGAVRRGETP